LETQGEDTNWKKYRERVLMLAVVVVVVGGKLK
jgi:hypothetical protein